MSKIMKIIVWVIVVALLGVGLWMVYTKYFSQSESEILTEEEQKVEETQAQLPIIRVSTNGIKTFLIGPTGMTLYVKSGEQNVSTCYGECAIEWMPLQPNNNTLSVEEGLAGKIGTINRTDGIKQVTYNNMPLYYWDNDKLVGDVTGDDVEENWSIAKP